MQINLTKERNAMISARKRANDQLSAWIIKQVDGLKSKGFSEDQAIAKLGNKIDEWSAENDRIASGERIMSKMNGAGSQRGYDDSAEAETKAVRGPLSPLHIPESEYRGLFEAAKKRLPSYRIDTKGAFAESSFTSGNLPPILMPQLTLDLPYEPDRAFSHFTQLTAPEARAVEYLQHTGNTNPAAAVAELGTKPDLGVEVTTVTTPFVKIAAIASASTELLQDSFGVFMKWLPQELQRAIIDAETNEVVNGSGSSPHMLGLLNVSGTLSRAIGSDSPVDCAAQVRVILWALGATAITVVMFVLALMGVIR